jgi:hypothetical protein
MHKRMIAERKGLLLVACLVVGGVLAKEKEAVVAKQDVIATLTKEQVSEFTQYVRAKELRSQEYGVCERMIVEKRRELKKLQDEMKKEFDMSPDHSYTYEMSTQTLFLLSTNKVDKAGKPEKTVIKKIKTGGESEFLSSKMLARKLTEQQIVVLAQLCEEKKIEFQQTDNQLRQKFKLGAGVSYRLDDKTGQVIRLHSAPTAGAPTAPGIEKDSGDRAGAKK